MKQFDASHINKKNVKPINPLIFQTAADLCATWFDIALSSGLPRGKYVGRGDRPIKQFVADHLEKFLPLAISILIDMLKPTSNCNVAMRATIYDALIDPLNDPEIMAIGKNNTKQKNEQMVLDAIKNFDKNQMKIKDILSPVLAKNELLTKTDLKSSTVLGKANG